MRVWWPHAAGHHTLTVVSHMLGNIGSHGRWNQLKNVFDSLKLHVIALLYWSS